MVFNSIEFLIFYPIVVLIYFIIPQRIKYIWLLIASYYFYMCWNAKYALLILFSTIITYISGLVLEKVKNLVLDEKKRQTNKKSVVALSFVLNLTVLFYFKYINFALNIINKVFAHMNIPFIHFRR